MESIQIGGKYYHYYETSGDICYDCVIFSGISTSSATMSRLDIVISGVDIPEGYELWYFNRLFVQRESRKSGVGTFLLDRVKDFATKRKIAIFCEVNPYGGLTLEETVRFYEKRGFCRICEDRVLYIPNDEDQRNS